MTWIASSLDHRDRTADLVKEIANAAQVQASQRFDLCAIARQLDLILCQVILTDRNQVRQ